MIGPPFSLLSKNRVPATFSKCIAASSAAFCRSGYSPMTVSENFIVSILRTTFLVDRGHGVKPTGLYCFLAHTGQAVKREKLPRRKAQLGR